MRFDTILKNGTIVTATQTRTMIVCTTLLAIFFITFGDASLAQKPSDSPTVPEMLVTEQGFLAIDTPKGWVRSSGPGLAYFVPRGERKGEPLVWIYISSAPIGPKEEAKDAKAYIQSDIAGFKERFKGGFVKEEQTIDLPKLNARAPVFTFQSGEKRNALEQVVYVEEINRVLTLVLSARERASFSKSVPVFHEFVKSYGGSIIPAPNSK